MQQAGAVELKAGDWTVSISGIVNAYHALNSVITLVAEVGQTRSKDFFGNTAHLNVGSLGGIIFF